jgi:DNA repair exonuclease SbcCD ATPase subunit
MSNKHDLPIAAHAVIMTRGPVLRLVVRDDVADEVACQYRNNGVDCDVVQLVRHSDALATIQRLEAEIAALQTHHVEKVVALERSILALESKIEVLKAENEALKKDANEAATALPQAVRNERERWEAAVRAARKLIDPLHPAGQPGSYARGFDVGVETAMRTLREALDAAMTKEQRHDHS